MAVLQIKKPHDLVEIDESGSIVVITDNIQETKYNLTGVLCSEKEVCVYYDGKSKIVSTDLIPKLDYNFEMKVDYKEVIRKYKLPKYPLYYFLSFKQKKMLSTVELNYEFKKSFYDSLDPVLKKCFDSFTKSPSLFVLNMEITENSTSMIGKLLSTTNQLFHCNGYIMYERKKKNKPSKIKCALIMNSGIYEYNNPKTLEFNIKFTSEDDVKKIFN
jgi:hypothetical protein